ncbi:MAG: UbiA family prenyltransferase [Rubrivivax sp.]|nr:UbiA family prenyltransferase [Rubrivivax sp.]
MTAQVPHAFAANGGPLRRLTGRAHLALRLVRISRPLLAGGFTFLGGVLAGGWPAGGVAAGAGLAALSVSCITAFAFVVNDCFDVAADRLGKPDRPLPAGDAAPSFAWRLAGGLAATGLGFAAALGPLAAAYALAALGLSFAYSAHFKRTLLLGNASIALLVASTLPFGAVAANGNVNFAIALGAWLSFQYVLAQEVLFTLEDLDSDQAAGLKTTATILGRVRCARLVQCLMLVFVASAFAPWLAGRGDTRYALLAGAGCVAPALWIALRLRCPNRRDRIAEAARWSRLPWLASFPPLFLLQ